MANPELLERYGKAGRIRAAQHFGWDAIAQQTLDLYRSVIH